MNVQNLCVCGGGGEFYIRRTLSLLSAVVFNFLGHKSRTINVSTL
jgi:hypothetical protein